MALRVLFALSFPLAQVVGWLAPADHTDQLKGQLDQLRSELSGDSEEVAPTIIAKPPAVPAQPPAVKPVVLAQQRLPGDDADIRTLDIEVHQGLEREQQLTEQLHASETSSAWLADQLHNSRAKVQELERNKAEAVKRASSDEERLKKSSDETAKAKVEVKKLHDHEKWLGRMVKKMLKADKELQKQTDGLEKQVKALKVEKKEFLRRNAKLAKGKAESEQSAVDTKKELEKTKDRAKRQETEKEALKKFFDDKEVTEKKEEEAFKAKVADEIKQRERKLKDLEAKFDAQKVQGVEFQEKQAAAEAREKDAEDKEAESQVTIRNLQAEIDAIKVKNREIKATNDRLHETKLGLEDKINATLGDVKEARAAEKKAKENTCVSLKRKVHQAERTKSLMHHALQDAVKLGQKLQKENGMLRQALKHTKEHLNQLMTRDSEASRALRNQIEKLHRQLQQHEAIPVAPPQFGEESAEDGPAPMDMPMDDPSGDELDQEEDLQAVKQGEESEDADVAAEDEEDLKDEAEAGSDDNDSLEELPPRPLSARLAMIQEETSAVRKDEESIPRELPPPDLY